MIENIYPENYFNSFETKLLKFWCFIYKEPIFLSIIGYFVTFFVLIVATFISSFLQFQSVIFFICSASWFISVVIYFFAKQIAINIISGFDRLFFNRSGISELEYLSKLVKSKMVFRESKSEKELHRSDFCDIHGEVCSEGEYFSNLWGETRNENSLIFKAYVGRCFSLGKIPSVYDTNPIYKKMFFFMVINLLGYLLAFYMKLEQNFWFIEKEFGIFSINSIDWKTIFMGILAGSGISAITLSLINDNLKYVPNCPLGTRVLTEETPKTYYSNK